MRQVGRRVGKPTSANPHFSAHAAWTSIFCLAVLLLAATLTIFGSSSSPAGGIGALTWRQRLAESEANATSLAHELKTARKAAEAEKEAKQKAEERVKLLQGKLRSEENRTANAAPGSSENLDANNAEVEAAKEEAAAAQSQVAKLQQQLQEVREQLRQLADSKGISPAELLREGPVVPFLRSMGHQQLMAVVLGFIGALTVLGPSSFLRLALPMIGSAVAGFLVAAWCSVMVGEIRHDSMSWVDCATLLLQGNAAWTLYALWLFIWCLGLLRWVMGIECSLYTFVDDVSATESDAEDADESRSLDSGLPRRLGSNVGISPSFPVSTFSGRTPVIGDDASSLATGLRNYLPPLPDDDSCASSIRTPLIGGQRGRPQLATTLRDDV
mmetsp:Transcript_45401/g.97331  ORF Transcript_45401/g.97331 Transcript_45401/m.97331 type:complete len:385 (+) Transcript_45401:89-1243(+)